MSIWALDNPVVTKELRGRMRGARTYWLLFGYLLLLSLILFFSYLGWWNSHSNAMDTGGATEGFTVGRMFFKILFYSQAVMIALITPALTAGAISIEREQRTFEMLRSTTLRPPSIVWGKLASSVSFVVLLLTSSLPLLSLCFLLGGVSPGEVFFAYLLLIGDAFLFGAIGLCWSAYAANTATATVLSYATLIFFFLATIVPAAPAIEEFGRQQSYGLCALNPIGAVTGAVMPEHYYGWTLPAWIPALLLNGTLSALLVLACINRLEDFPHRRATALRLVTLLFIGLVVFFGNGALLEFAPKMGSQGSIQILLTAILACVLLLLFVPVLVTGDLAEWGKNARHLPFLVRSWSPRRIFGDATLPSGLPLALLLTVIVLGLCFGADRLGAFQSTVGVMQRNGPLSPVAAQMMQASLTAVFEQIAVMLVLIVVGIAGLGFLLSVTLGNRWSSLTLLYLVIILANALPFFSYAMLSGEDARAVSSNPAINSLYLCPFVPLCQLTKTLDLGYMLPSESPIRSMAGYGVWPLWMGTGVVYLTVGIVSYILALAILRRRELTKTV